MSGYETQSADTSREIEELLFAAYRRMSSSEKLARIGALGQLVEKPWRWPACASSTRTPTNGS